MYVFSISSWWCIFSTVDQKMMMTAQNSSPFIYLNLFTLLCFIQWNLTPFLSQRYSQSQPFIHSTNQLLHYLFYLHMKFHIMTFRWMFQMFLKCIIMCLPVMYNKSTKETTTCIWDPFIEESCLNQLFRFRIHLLWPSIESPHPWTFLTIS